MEREPMPQSAQEAAEDDYWNELYGPWEPFGPEEVRTFLAGFDRPWWLVGGWAIEAFTGAPREHEDVDLSILACDVPALRAHVGQRWQLWNIADGALRPLIDRWPDAEPESQIWVRRDVRSPWVLDLPITPDVEGQWRSKRDPAHVAPLEDVTWVADDGIRYLNPEITLHYKARLDRLKDRRDLDRTWPLLGAEQRAWLRDAVRREDAEHPWLPLLDGA